MANLTPKLEMSSIGSGIESVPAMDIRDWRSHLPPDSREKVINKIMEKLMKHLPFPGPEGINELRRIAARFEENIFNGAINQTDYLRKISMKMLTMETKSQNAANNSLLLNPEPAVNTDDWRSLLPSDSRKKNANKIMETLKEQVPNCGQQGTKKPKRIATSLEELIFNSAIDQSVPAMVTIDWRSHLPPDSRGKIINRIMETLKKHLPFSGPEGIIELRRIAARFEEKIFSSAVNQTDYLRKISLKLLTMETKSQNAAASSSSSPSILAANNSLLLIPGHHMDNSKPSLPKAKRAVNTDDWRCLLPSDSRKKNVNKIMETLKNHVPNCGQQGTNTLKRIAASFEELIFNSAIDQVDYFRKISFKMQTMEEGD